MQKACQYLYSKGMSRILMAACAALVLCACGDKPTTMEDLSSVDVQFPNGVKIRAEAMNNDADRQRGLMYRDSLPQNRGMLFYHPREAPNRYYTFQVKFPIDIVWMDHTRKIVEIAHDVPPCTNATPVGCPVYGGNIPSLFVLETNAGFADRNGLKIGDVLIF